MKCKTHWRRSAAASTHRKRRAAVGVNRNIVVSGAGEDTFRNREKKKAPFRRYCVTRGVYIENNRGGCVAGQCVDARGQNKKSW